MTSISPDPQGTGALPIVVIVDDRAARHRTNTPTHDGPPAWLQLAATIAAVAASWFAILQWRDPAAPLLMGAALLIAVAALGLDVTAAVRAHRDDSDEVQS